MELTIYLTSTLKTHLIYMELILKRIAKKKAYTIGRLSLSTKSLTPDPSPEGEGREGRWKSE